MKGFLAFLAIAAGLPQDGQVPVKVGSLQFTPPKGWKASSDSGPKEATFNAPELPAGKSCLFRVFPEESDKDGFRPWFNRRWNRTVSGTRPVLRMSEMASQKIEGVEALLRSCAYKKGNGEAYLLCIGLSVGSRYIAIFYEADDFELMEAHQQEVYGIFDSFKISNEATPGNTSPEVTKPHPNPTTTNPGTVGNPTVPASSPSPSGGISGVYLADSMPSRISRLSEIASELQDPKKDAQLLLTESARLCGFAIWTEDRAKKEEPIGSPRLRLALTDVEIKEYAELFRSGDRVAMADLIAAIDLVYKELGATGSCGPPIFSWLHSGVLSQNPSIRALTSFLQDLGASRRRDPSPGLTQDAILDPIQALLILRVMTEDTAVPLRKAIHAGVNTTWWAMTSLPSQETELPNWAEDAYATLATTLWEEVATRTDDLDSVAKSKIAGRLNTLLGIVKFIATYCYLKGEMFETEAGKPLIRTKTRRPGAEKTISARFTIDGSRVTDWLKDHRTLVATAGLDIDMPKTGPLKGIGTEWDYQPGSASGDGPVWPSVKTARLSNIVTDDKGVARVTFEGRPQDRELDPNRVMPVPKMVWVTVTPQVKDLEFKQALVDAVTSAIGIRQGPAGFVTLLMEVLYRMKWNGTRGMMLYVRDWTPAESIGQFKIEIQASGRDFDKTGAYQWTLNRSLEFKDVQMSMSGGQALPAFDPALLPGLTEAQRKELEANLKKAGELSKQLTFVGGPPGAAMMHIDDYRFISRYGACEEEATSDTTTWKGKYDQAFQTRLPNGPDMMFRVMVDEVKKTAIINANLGLLVDYVNIHKDSKGGMATERKKLVMGIFSELKPFAPFSANGPIELPMKETPVIDMPGATNFYGTTEIPFAFGRDVLGKPFLGKALVSFSITRKRTPPK